jgi:hypothetical protein
MDFHRWKTCRRRQNELQLSKPFILRKFNLNNLLTWDDLDHAIKNSKDKEIEIISIDGKKLVDPKEGQKKHVKYNSVVLTNCKHLFDFKFIKDFVDNKKLFPYRLWNAHIYASYNNKSSSFKKHLDYAHNFIMPQTGKSRWVVENFCDTLLYPGDMLYIPYKWKHECIPTEKRISLSFPFWMDPALMSPADNEKSGIFK